MISRVKFFISPIIICQFQLMILGCFTSVTVSAALVPDSFSGIVNKSTKSVVNISKTQAIKTDFEGRERGFRRRSLGSGFIVYGDSYIITNNHVVKNTIGINVTLWDESEYKAKVKVRDQKTDIALIKVDADKPLTALTIGDSNKLNVGDLVTAMGNPFGHIVTEGILSAKSRFIGSRPYDDFIQTDAAINSGNSGVQLFNIKGEVVGIKIAIIPMAQGLCFAIPVNLVKEIVRQLKTKGHVERGCLVVTVQKITPELAGSLKLTSKHDALVTDILKNSPADKAKIKREDVILYFVKEKISEYSLPRLVAAMPNSKHAVIKVIRDGKPVELTA